jgi:adenylate cyclase
MPVEIERKFLVQGADWRAAVERSELYRQGYPAGSKSCSVRVRVGGARAWLGLKGRVSDTVRLEYEYAIPVDEANEILDALCDGGRVEKRRHWVPYAGRQWEVDEFLGANAGLVVAELELDDENEVFSRPPWLGREVTDDARFLNTSLAGRPWTTWSDDERRAAR